MNEIRKPTLVLDERKCRNNIRMMAMKAKDSGVIFRPHFKTHQSATIGEWFRDEGVSKITVSSVTMAGYFSSRGWNDITVAFPFNIREVKGAKNISGITDINLLSSGYEHLKLLKGIIDFGVSIYIEIETGNRRTGVDWNDYRQVLRMIDLITGSHCLRMAGFLVHAGHTYNTNSVEGIREMYYDTLNKCLKLREAVNAPGIIISSGDTPSCSVIDDLSGFDEVRPGNFVFYDLMQLLLGSCRKEQIAVAVYCPVVDINLKRNEVLIYGGAVHLSKESVTLPDGRKVFGEIAFPAKNGWDFPDENIYLRSVSQEHGIISVPEKMLGLFRHGDLVAVIPVHSCLTADLLREYYTHDGRRIKDFCPK